MTSAMKRARHPRTPHKVVPNPPFFDRGWPHPKGKSVWIIETLSNDGELLYQWAWGKPLKYRTITDAIEVVKESLRFHVDPEVVFRSQFLNVKTREVIPFAALGL